MAVFGVAMRTIKEALAPLGIGIVAECTAALIFCVLCFGYWLATP